MLSGCDHGIVPDPVHGEKLRRLNSELEVEAQSGGVRFINGHAYDMREYGNCEKLYWRDTDHWSRQGVKEVSTTLLPLLGLHQ